ncbi:Uncharacterised protein [Raoultella terrigena]|uniref:N-acetyltransferase domain-containing protein n=1 Tax=Raoultella terrigena TaxID=577 RepID=A0A3P8J4H0_RAOTE|nr:Uncharacterised protein [Raoultella terrigena]
MTGRIRPTRFFCFANSTTVDFYPRFGFEQYDEYQYTLPVTPAEGDFRRLDMDKESDVAILRPLLSEIQSLLSALGAQ